MSEELKPVIETNASREEMLKAFQEELLAVLSKYGATHPALSCKIGDTFVGLFPGKFSDATYFETVIGVARLWQAARHNVRTRLDKFETSAW